MAKQPTQSDPTTWCFPKETLSFLKNLKTNNNRDWFTKHKTDYEQTIKKPAEEFCPLMTEALSDLTGLPHKAKIFRIYRDVRFSKNKAPYQKTRRPITTISIFLFYRTCPKAHRWAGISDWSPAA